MTGRWLALFGLLVGTGVALIVSDTKVSAAACPAAGTDLGVDTITINVPAAATYTVWTRMKAPDASHNTVNLEIDGNNCYNIGGGTFTATSWADGSGNWIKYEDGNTASVVSLALSAGNHTLKYVGTQAGVEIDRVILSSDASCTPTGTGTNCQPGDSTNPIINLIAPTAGQTITGNVTFQATASDADSGVSKVEFLVNNQVVNSDTATPYEYSWNSASVSNGAHSIAARATDAAGNSATSTAVSVTVSNSGGGTTGPARGDLNSSGKVDITDLSILLTNWNKSGVTPAQGDTNSSGKVDITDLSILLSNWGK